MPASKRSRKATRFDASVFTAAPEKILAVTSSAVVVWNPDSDVVHACPISTMDRIPLIPKAKQILAIFEDTGLLVAFAEPVDGGHCVRVQAAWSGAVVFSYAVPNGLIPYSVSMSDSRISFLCGSGEQMQLVSLVWNFDNPFANSETHVNLTNALTAVDSNITYLASDEGVFRLSVMDDSLTSLIVPGAGTPAFLLAKDGYVIVGYDTKVVVFTDLEGVMAVDVAGARYGMLSGSTLYLVHGLDAFSIVDLPTRVVLVTYTLPDMVASERTTFPLIKESAGELVAISGVGSLQALVLARE